MEIDGAVVGSWDVSLNRVNIKILCYFSGDIFHVDRWQ